MIKQKIYAFLPGIILGLVVAYFVGLPTRPTDNLAQKIIEKNLSSDVIRYGYVSEFDITNVRYDCHINYLDDLHYIYLADLDFTGKPPRGFKDGKNAFGFYGKPGSWEIRHLPTYIYTCGGSTVKIPFPL